MRQKYNDKTGELNMIPDSLEVGVTITPGASVIYDGSKYEYNKIVPTATTSISFEGLKYGGMYNLEIDNTSNYTINFAAKDFNGTTLLIKSASGTKPAVSTTGVYILTVLCVKGIAYFFYQGPMSIFTN